MTRNSAGIGRGEEQPFSFGHVDSFSAVDLPKGAKAGYAEFRAAVLMAGRFSAFEASENQRTALYTMLCRDPEIETDTASIGYPWTKVRLRARQPQQPKD